MEKVIKKCTSCKRELDLDSFHSNKRMKDKKDNVCKKCRSKFNALTYKKNKNKQ